MSARDERDVLARAQGLIDNLVSNADDFTRSDLLDALGSLSVTLDSLIEELTPKPDADVVEAEWADWFEAQSSHLGGKPVFSGDEVAALLRGARPFGRASGIEVKS